MSNSNDAAPTPHTPAIDQAIQKAKADAEAAAKAIGEGMKEAATKAAVDAVVADGKAAIEKAAPALLAAGGKVEGAVDVAKDDAHKAVAEVEKAAESPAVAKAEGAVKRIAEEVWGEVKRVETSKPATATAAVLVAGTKKTFTFVGEHADHLAALFAGHGSFAGVLRSIRAWLGVRSHEVAVGVVVLLAVLLMARLVVIHDLRAHAHRATPVANLHGADLLSTDGQSVVAHVDGVATTLHMQGSKYTVLHLADNHTMVWDGPIRILP